METKLIPDWHLPTAEMISGSKWHIAWFWRTLDNNFLRKAYWIWRTWLPEDRRTHSHKLYSSIFPQCFQLWAVGGVIAVLVNNLTCFLKCRLPDFTQVSTPFFGVTSEIWHRNALSHILGPIPSYELLRAGELCHASWDTVYSPHTSFCRRIREAEKGQDIVPDHTLTQENGSLCGYHLSLCCSLQPRSGIVT